MVKKNIKKRIQIAMRDGLKCSRCQCALRFPNEKKDERPIARLSHEIPKSAGGTDANKNLTLICFDCESERHKEYMPADIRVNGESAQPIFGERLNLKLA